jgi:NifU-like protein involved in Fe-S cluster formation
MIDELYSANILRLAANMPRAGRLAAPDASAEKVARLCGSRIVVDVKLEDGKVVDFAQEVKACALGQAAAAVLGAHVIGATCEEIAVARDAFRAMLKSGGPPPAGRFSDLSMLEPVKDYPQRHASSMLAFEATVEACRLAQDHGHGVQAPAEAGSRTSPADVA